MQLIIDLDPQVVGRISGRMSWAGGAQRVPFGGWLELLRLIECALDSAVVRTELHRVAENDGVEGR